MQCELHWSFFYWWKKKNTGAVGMKVNNMHEIVKKNKQCCFCWLGFCNFQFFNVRATVSCLSITNAKPKQMKLSVDSHLAQHWTFLLWDNEDDFHEQRAADSFPTPWALVLPPMTLKDPDKLSSHLPPSSQTERQPRLVWTFSGRELTDQRILSTVRQNPRETSGLSLCLSVWSMDHPTTIALPQIAVRDYLFGEPQLFF